MAKNVSGNNGKASAPAPKPAALSTDVKADMLKAMSEATETGFEQTSGADFSIPFLALLQKMSPQIDNSDDAYVQGAQAGQFYNSASGKVYDKVQVVPCSHKRSMVEWKPDRGGFVAQHEPGVEAGLPQNEKGQFVLPNGNLLIDTRYFMCIQIDDSGVASPVIVAMASTQIKVAKTWMSRMSMMKLDGPHGKFTPPMYSHIWELSSLDKKNEHGSWKLYKVELVGPIDSTELFNSAKENRKMFASASIAPQPLLTEGPSGGERNM